MLINYLRRLQNIAEYLERRERVYEEMERERIEEERKLQEKQIKETNEYNHWKKTFVVVDEPGDDYEMEMKNMKQIVLEYLSKNQIIDFDTISLEELGIKHHISSKEIKELLQEMVDENDIFGVFDERNRFVYFSEKELNDLADVIQNYDSCISVSNLLEDIGNVSPSRGISV